MRLKAIQGRRDMMRFTFLVSHNNIFFSKIHAKPLRSGFDHKLQQTSYHLLIVRSPKQTHNPSLKFSLPLFQLETTQVQPNDNLT